MFTLRALAAVSLFLFGTTFLWMTAAFAGRTLPPAGLAWSVENVLALLAVVAFSIAAWGLYKDLPWWQATAAVSSVIGLAAVVPYVVGVAGIGGFDDLGVQINLALHVLGSAAVLTLVVVPAASDWFGRVL